MIAKINYINKYTRYSVILILTSILISTFSVFGYIYISFENKIDEPFTYTSDDLIVKENNPPKKDSGISLTPQSVITLSWVSIGIVGNAIKEQSNNKFIHIIANYASFLLNKQPLSVVPINFNLMVSTQIFKLRISRLKAG